MRVAAAILDPAQQQGLAVAKDGGPGIENRVDGIRPVNGGKNGVLGKTVKERFVVILAKMHNRDLRFPLGDGGFAGMLLGIGPDLGGRRNVELRAVGVSRSSLAR
jgi:hypothetical protein